MHSNPVVIDIVNEERANEEYIMNIDIKYNMHTDSNYKDPDTYSKTLNTYHKFLWSKPLPNGETFKLMSNESKPLYLKLGEVKLSSDCIAHEYVKLKSMQHIISKIDKNDLNTTLDLFSTIGGYIIFPSYKIDNKATINVIRGLHPRLKDRFDLTLECIRRWYIGEESPLYKHLDRYHDFFNLFSNFKGYVDFFLLNDLVDESYNILFWRSFESFDTNPLPQNVVEYNDFIKNVSRFINSRNNRIAEWGNQKFKE